MIRLITGATCISGRLYRPESGAFTADKATEDHLVKAGAAVYVDGAAPAEPTPTEPDADAPVIEPEAPAPTVEADAPKKPAPKKGAAKK